MSDDQPPVPSRRGFLGTASTAAMAGGLIAGYGTFFGYAGRFLYPAAPTRTAWMFVTDIASFEVGTSMNYRTPAGASVVITRQGEENFLALSSTCPHLGCQVHWQASEERFFCPCHNGTFDKQGKGTGGPPGDAGQSLLKFPLKTVGGLLYVEVPIGRTARADGHDPCLRGLA